MMSEEYDLMHGNNILAKINRVKIIITSAQLQEYLDNGYDVEVISPC
jgi:hypothetical protein